MTRGFMYAESSRVIAGLWDADDLVTTELAGNLQSDGARQDGPSGCLTHHASSVAP